MPEDAHEAIRPTDITKNCPLCCKEICIQRSVQTVSAYLETVCCPAECKQAKYETTSVKDSGRRSIILRFLPSKLKFDGFMSSVYPRKTTAKGENQLFGRREALDEADKNWCLKGFKGTAAFCQASSTFYRSVLL